MIKNLVARPPRESHHARTCLVIGGGLAGLAAADRAKRLGWRIHLFEAEPELGGRVKSFQFHHPSGYCNLVCELGGEWIGKHHKTMLRLVKRFHLRKVNHEYCLSFWDVDRQVQTIYRPSQSPFLPEVRKKLDDYREVFQKLKTREQKELDKLDWWTKLKLLGLPPDSLLRRDLMDGTDFGESIRQTSAYVAAAEYLSKQSGPTDEMDFKIEGGNSLLIDRLEVQIGANSIHKGDAVVEVSQKNEIVEVHLNSGKRFKGDACICAIPASRYREITWKPRLSPEKIDAADQLQYARITKTAVLFQKRFWDDPGKGGAARPPSGGFSVFSDRVSDFCFDSTYKQDGPGGILCSYAIGDKADDIAAEPDVLQVGEWIKRDVCDAIGRNQANPRVLAVKRQAWQKQTSITGAYAFYRPGQWFTIRGALQKRHFKVHFAGEHIADEQGFMEGAAVTGIEAAKSL
jgi:monoamine oxidase